MLSELFGDENTRISAIAAVEDCGPGDLVFVDKKDYISLVLEKKPASVVTSKALSENLIGKTTSLFVAPSVSMAHALIKSKYNGRNYNDSGWDKIHPSAVIHETAHIDSTAVIEPRVVIGARVTVGKNTRIMAGCVIENDVVVGDNTIIQPLVIVGYGCVVGNDVLIGSGSVIGSEGFGFAQDAKRKSHAIPQTGNVVIGDRVRVGANNCIDRAAYKTTRIGAGTKLDNLCHIAHNVEIGEDCLLTAMLCVAGSSKIGDRVMTSGQTGILDHMTVCNDAVLLHRAAITKDLTTPGIYAGYPLLPLNQYLRNVAVLKQADELKKRVLELEKKISSLKD